jgi:hypothetical protein
MTWKRTTEDDKLFQLFLNWDEATAAADPARALESPVGARCMDQHMLQVVSSLDGTSGYPKSDPIRVNNSS